MRCAVLLVALLAVSGAQAYTFGQNAGNGTVQNFFKDMFGGNWTQLVPHTWSAPSFTWENLGTFDYYSNLGAFMEQFTSGNITKPQSLSEWHATMDKVGALFCTPETFVPSQHMYAACTGPKIVLEYVPKVCILDEDSQQVVCDPAKLVLSKTPGACTHKYKSPSVWTGKECKINGGAGISQSMIYGGNNWIQPLTTVDISIEP